MTNRRTSLAVLLATLTIAACGPVDDAELDLGVERHEGKLYYDPSTLWTSPQISVCWESPGSNTERGWVRTAVEAAYEPLFNVDFTGWNLCGTTGADIVIRVSDTEWPRSFVGTQNAVRSPGIFLNFFQGAPIDIDGDRDHEIDFPDCWKIDQAPIYTGRTGKKFFSQRTWCIQGSAVHEFGHALGLLHEQDRPDKPADCPSTGSDSFTAYGYWDLTSITNYCNPVWNNDGLLSPLDVAGLIDLYGARTNDQVWYGVGDVANYGGASVHQTLFDIRAPSAVTGTYLPVAGDFNGDGKDDMLWYGPSASDFIWFAGSSRGGWDQTVSISQVGSGYQVLAGDFDGDGFDDVLWHAAATGNDRIWWGRADRAFAKSSLTFTGPDTSYTPLAGDFDADGRTDVYFYSPTAPDRILWGQSDRTFLVGSFNEVSTAYRPFTGDFDGDGSSDIYWYSPGSAADFIWWGRTNRTFTSTRMDVSGTYDVATGDFDGNGTSDILWSGSSDGIWLFSRTRGSRVGTKTESHLGSLPYAGDFDGDGISDIFWYAPG